MTTFDVWSLAKLLRHIDHSLEVIKPLATADAKTRDTKLSQDEIDLWLFSNVLLGIAIAQQIHLQSTYDRLWEGGGPFWMACKTGLTFPQAFSELRFLRQAIEADLEKSTFIFVSRSNADLLTGINDLEPVWKAIANTETCRQFLRLGRRYCGGFSADASGRKGAQSILLPLGFQEREKHKEVWRNCAYAN